MNFKPDLLGKDQALLYALPMPIGENIRLARKKLRMSQGTLGAKVGNLTAQAVSNWENGGGVEFERLPIIARVLKTTVAALTDEKPGLSREEQDVLDLLGRLKSGEKEGWLAALRAYVEKQG